MFRTIIWFIYFWLFMICVIPHMLYVQILTKKQNHEKAYEFSCKVAKNWARRLIKLAGGNVIVEGLENIPENGAFVAVSNHQGSFDIPILLAYTGKLRGIVAKKELEKMPLVSFWMTKIKCFFIDRKNAKHGAKTVLETIRYVKSGGSITIFPEGTRSKSDKMSEFQDGAFVISKKAKAPLLPITINGSYKLMEQNGFIIKPATIYVKIHPLILFENQDENISETVKEIIESGLKAN